MLATTPVLASPLPKEPMLLYIAATNRVVSVVIVVERKQEDKLVQRPVYYLSEVLTVRVVSVVVVVERKEEDKLVQRPVYYLSEVLTVSKQNYPHYQKMTYGVYMVAKKLKHYFQENDIKVVCTAPISEIIGNKDASGRIAKWAIELAPYTPAYERCDAVKTQALADFFVDWAEAQYEPPLPNLNYWKMHFDGSKCLDGLGAGVVITSPKKDKLEYMLQIHFAASNNVAEYESLVHGLKMAKEIGIRRNQCFGD